MVESLCDFSEAEQNQEVTIYGILFSSLVGKLGPTFRFLISLAVYHLVQTSESSSELKSTDAEETKTEAKIILAEMKEEFTAIETKEETVRVVTIVSYF